MGLHRGETLGATLAYRSDVHQAQFWAGFECVGGPHEAAIDASGPGRVVDGYEAAPEQWRACCAWL